MGNLLKPPSMEKITQNMCKPDAVQIYDDQCLLSYAEQGKYVYTKFRFSMKYRCTNQDMILSNMVEAGSAVQWKSVNVNTPVWNIMLRFKNEYRDSPNFTPSRQLLDELHQHLLQIGCSLIELKITECIPNLPCWIPKLNGYRIHEAYQSSTQSVFHVLTQVDLLTFYVDAMSPSPRWVVKSYGTGGQVFVVVVNRTSRDVLQEGCLCKMTQTSTGMFQIVQHLSPLSVIQKTVNECKVTGVSMPVPGGQHVVVPPEWIKSPWEQASSQQFPPQQQYQPQPQQYQHQQHFPPQQGASLPYPQEGSPLPYPQEGDPPPYQESPLPYPQDDPDLPPHNTYEQPTYPDPDINRQRKLDYKHKQLAKAKQLREQIKKEDDRDDAI